MKTLLILLYLALAASEFTGVEVPVELPQDTKQAELIRLQLEEAALTGRYRDGHPSLVQLREQIATLLAVPEIRNDVYFAVLGESLTLLQAERIDLLSKFRPANPRVVAVERKIAFAEKELAERK